MLQNRATLKQIRFHLLGKLRQIYAENESESIARLILEHIGYPLSLILRDPDQVPASPAHAQINEIVAEIHTGKPIQYILGYTHFCDLKIKVDKNVLIPRPETEELVEEIKARVTRPIQKIIDMGTGSGCIALALKQYFPESEVWAVDFSKEALIVAAENERINKLQVNWRDMDLLNDRSFDQSIRFNLVVSNPPYVMENERKLMDRNVTAFEPESALYVEDHDPLIFYRAIASFCSRHLAENGELWVEINEQLGRETALLFTSLGFARVRILKDIHEKERFIHARR